MDRLDQFTRVRWLLEDKFQTLQEAKILVCGCGGVGGVCIDTLLRSGALNLTIIDFDKFELTNQNRQLYSQHLGAYKVDVFKQIYPSITALNFKLTPEIISQMDFTKYDVVVDAIDDMPAKIALAHATWEKLCSSMGGAKRIDPTAIKTASIWKSSDDPFARKFRYELKKSGFDGDFEVVFSTEKPLCKNMGSFMGVTASFGLTLAWLVLKKLI